jgi:CubicO group peptidase (beta-lactamase class C family)
MLLTELPRTREAIEAGIQAGLHPGAVVYASLGGEPVVEAAFGEARPGVPFTIDSVALWMSSTKPIGAVAIMQHVERGQLGLDDRVSQHIPEFAAGGKQAITVRHLLTHAGGFRWVDLRDADRDWNEIIRRICASPLEADWVPGEKAGYHPLTSWFILGELVRRLDGRPFSQYVRDEILLPLGMNDSWIGMPPEQFTAYGDRLAITLEFERPSPRPHPYSTLPGATACVPGGNGHGPARELGRFYEMLLGKGTRDGVSILTADSVAQMTQRQRIGMYDVTFRHTLDFGLGLIINSARYGADTVPYGYGPYASEASFGHSGNQSSVAFCDPERQLVAVIIFNGMPGEAKHQQRIRHVLEALYTDLKLA